MPKNHTILDTAEQIGSVAATLSAISDGVKNRQLARSLAWLAELLDQAVEDIYHADEAAPEGVEAAPCE